MAGGLLVPVSREAAPEMGILKGLMRQPTVAKINAA
jgi:hypothetical protein